MCSRSVVCLRFDELRTWAATRLAELPRSIDWDNVRRMLETVDKRTPVGRRDYAILLLLVTYGLRAREVALRAAASRGPPPSTAAGTPAPSWRRWTGWRRPAGSTSRSPPAAAHRGSCAWVICWGMLAPSRKGAGYARLQDHPTDATRAHPQAARHASESMHTFSWIDCTPSIGIAARHASVRADHRAARRTAPRRVRRPGAFDLARLRQDRGGGAI